MALAICGVHYLFSSLFTRIEYRRLERRICAVANKRYFLIHDVTIRNNNYRLFEAFHPCLSVHCEMLA